MARALHQHCIRRFGDLCHRVLDLLHLGFAGDVAFNVVCSISLRYDHRAHVVVADVIERKVLLHDLHILVDTDLTSVDGDWNVLLSDGLDEANAAKPLFQALHERERDRRFAHMLPRRRDKDWPGRRHEREEGCGDPNLRVPSIWLLALGRRVSSLILRRIPK